MINAPNGIYIASSITAAAGLKLPITNVIVVM
jgi:hypothetical protein